MEVQMSDKGSVSHKNYLASQMGWESGRARKLFQDDQEARLVQNTIDS